MIKDKLKVWDSLLHIQGKLNKEVKWIPTKKERLGTPSPGRAGSCWGGKDTWVVEREGLGI